MIFSLGNDIYRQIQTNLVGKELLFLGEFPHHNRSVQAEVYRLATELAQRTAFRILAAESSYELYPEVERASLLAAEHVNIDTRITAYNKKVSRDKRIVVTAIDIAHSIKHSPALVTGYLQTLFQAVQDKALLSEVGHICEAIASEKESKGKERCIEQLKTLVCRYKDEIELAVFSEWQFYLQLLSVSLHCGLPKSEEERKTFINTRNQWFIETIKRAIQRQQFHQSKMICYVGAPHAYKAYLNTDDCYVGPTPEAKCFNDSLYPGQVWSILIRPFCMNDVGEKDTKTSTAIESHALEKLGNEKAIYIDVREYKTNYGEDGIRKYCQGNEFQYDGILYVVDEYGWECGNKE